MTPMTDLQVRNKGFHILLQELGSVDTVRFLSQISHEIRDYMTIQDELFKDLTIDELYEQAKRYQEQKSKAFR
jgi:hypothetical protein